MIPENWCIQGCNELRELLNPYTNLIGDNRLLFYYHPSHTNDYLTSTMWKHTNHNGYDSALLTPITIEQFKEHIKQPIMNKKIIGYKLIKTEFHKAVNIMLEKIHHSLRNDGITKDVFTHEFLRQAGVLDLWFEPVYDDRLKFGEHEVTFLSCSNVKIGCQTFSKGQLQNLKSFYRDEYKFECKVNGIEITEEFIERILAKI